MIKNFTNVQNCEAVADNAKKISLTDEDYNAIANEIADAYLEYGAPTMDSSWYDGDEEFMYNTIFDYMGIDDDTDWDDVDVDVDRLWDSAYEIYSDKMKDLFITDILDPFCEYLESRVTEIMQDERGEAEYQAYEFGNCDVDNEMYAGGYNVTLDLNKEMENWNIDYHYSFGDFLDYFEMDIVESLNDYISKYIDGVDGADYDYGNDVNVTFHGLLYVENPYYISYDDVINNVYEDIVNLSNDDALLEELSVAENTFGELMETETIIANYIINYSDFDYTEFEALVFDVVHNHKWLLKNGALYYTPFDDVNLEKVAEEAVA